MALTVANKRRHPRAPLDTKVKLTGGARGQTFEATVRMADVSLGGVFFASTFALKIGSPLRAHFDLEEFGRVEADGVVVRIEHYDERLRKGRNGFALKFTQLEGDAAVALASIFLAPRVRVFAERYLRTRGSARRGRTEHQKLVDALVVWEMERET